MFVLIESDWNLKSTSRYTRSWSTTVLIESDWNLKTSYQIRRRHHPVCINRIRLEFKVHTIDHIHKDTSGINRIRLEFKDENEKEILRIKSGINRIRLEFKGLPGGSIYGSWFVLIESDWNLKIGKPQRVSGTVVSINRIRLEFKAEYGCNKSSSGFRY